MTVASETNRSGPYTGNGVTTDFNYGFRILAESHIQVVLTENDIDTVVNPANYTVSGVGDAAGGSITMATAPTATQTLTIIRNLPFTQTTDLENQGAYYAETIEEALDLATMRDQELQEQIDRSLKIPVGQDSSTLDNLIADVVRLNDSVDNVDTVAGSITNVNTVAGNIANVNTVGGISADVSAVAAIDADVTVAADNIAAIVDAPNQASAAAASATAAATSETNAAGSATAAAGSATNAATSETNAAGSASAAATSATNASNSASAAAGSASAASTSETNAAASASAASTSETNAATSASNAATSETNAASSATAAAGSASAASTSETNAATSASAAATSETNAASSATSAAGSATSAANSAAAAAASLDNFDDRYLGPKDADPTVDNDGNPLLTGALYYNNVAREMRVYDGANWIAASSAGNSSLLKYEYTATTGQTTFSGADDNAATLSYTAANIIVALNGVILDDGADYAASDGTSIVLTSGAAAGDLLTVIAFKSFTVADTVPASTGGTFLGNVTAPAFIGDGSQLTGLPAPSGFFAKEDASAVAWTKTGNGTAETQTAIYAEVNGSVLTVASGTSITMPTLTAGTDYAIWLETDGDLVATTDHTSPPTANARKIGGFHYAAGGNATAQSGGNTTAQINEYSFWDLNFRPACPDPRGMTLVGGGFWVDIYLTGVDAITNGSSKYNVTIADGSSPPKVPTMFGGNGSTTYGSYTWFEAQELATAFGKRCLTQLEFMSAMYGTTEASSIGSDPVTTNWDAAYVSKWGINQATGCMWVWGRDRGGPAAGASWNANTEGRGSEYNAPNASRFGGVWASGSDAGSRCSRWNIAASHSGVSVGSRFACDHLQLG